MYNFTNTESCINKIILLKWYLKFIFYIGRERNDLWEDKNKWYM